MAAPDIGHLQIFPAMVNAADIHLVQGRSYRVVARFTDSVMIYRGELLGDGNPVFEKNLVTMMIPWPAIERLEPVDE